ncbi:MAG: hypothetical protein PVJ21_20230 [Anaerolineales bacterium]|jgi:hypothetical protein
MSTSESRQFRLFGWIAVAATILQTFGGIRYINRQPDDWVGIMLYAITLFAFIAVSIGSYIQARRKDN